jgi:hypothetical protein
MDLQTEQATSTSMYQTFNYEKPFQYVSEDPTHASNTMQLYYLQLQKMVAVTIVQVAVTCSNPKYWMWQI